MLKLFFKSVFMVIFLSGTFLFINSCATHSVPIQVLVPAEINVPQHIRKVVIANRSLPKDHDKTKNIIEGFFTGESVFADREGSENCVRGLANQLNTSSRFEAVLIENSDLRGTGTKSFEKPLSWYLVGKICEDYDADALILLETFDSDISINKRSREETRKDDDREYKVRVYYADLNIFINAGWRIYDNERQVIVDQNVFRDAKSWTGKGEGSEKRALRELPNKRAAINDAGYFAGQRFGVRISPSWINTSREYYIRKPEDFKKAKKYVQNNDWDEAQEIWMQYVENPEKKIGGRACFNMGIAKEMEGDFESALKWMKRAYYDYDIKKAQRYINILNRRIEDQKRLDEQLGD